MKWVLDVNITHDGDFSFKSKWTPITDDGHDNTTFFDNREDCVKAFKQCYNDIINTIHFGHRENYLGYIRDNLKKLQNHIDDICEKESFQVYYDCGNQNFSFEVGIYNEEKCSVSSKYCFDVYDYIEEN